MDAYSYQIAEKYDYLHIASLSSVHSYQQELDETQLKYCRWLIVATDKRMFQ